MKNINLKQIKFRIKNCCPQRMQTGWADSCFWIITTDSSGIPPVYIFSKVRFQEACQTAAPEGNVGIASLSRWWQKNDLLK